MTRIIITGARGLLGKQLVPILEGEGAEVIALDRPAFDLSQPLDLGQLPERADAVVYLAQSRRFREFPGGAGDMFQVNVSRVTELLDYAERTGVRSFVYASTGGVYAPSERPIDEQSPLADPMGFYPASKRSAELLAQCYAGRMNVAVLRYFFIYGPGQQPDMLVPRLIDSVRTGSPINLQGQDGLRLCPVHALDAARATAAATKLDRSAVINVAGPEALSLRAMGEVIGDVVGKEPRFEVRDAPEAIDYVADTARMRELLSSPALRFRDAIGELAG